MAKALGFIRVQDRTQSQHDAHARALSFLRPLAQYTLPTPELAKGDRVTLYAAWKHPDVVTDVGMAFDRFHQETGSCVGAGGGNALFSTVAAQRLISDSPTKAFLPFWLAPYGVSRHLMGDDGQGEGSMGSSFAEALTTTGIVEWVKGGDLPSFNDQDGIDCGGPVEMTWSSYRNRALAAVLAKSKGNLLGSAATCSSVADIKAAVLNGYGVSFACDNYVGHGTIKGSGDDAYVTGYWDGSGGHQQSIHAVWEHPNDGPLYWAQNNWPGSTYPKDPAGGPVCGVWVPEAKVEAAMHLHAEVFAFSHLNWFPAQPIGKLMDWSH